MVSSTAAASLIGSRKMVARRVLVVAAVTASALTPVLRRCPRGRLASTRSTRCAALGSTPDDDDDDEYAGASQGQLDAVTVKNFEFDTILSKEEAGELDLTPYF